MSTIQTLFSEQRSKILRNYLRRKHGGDFPTTSRTIVDYVATHGDLQDLSDYLKENTGIGLVPRDFTFTHLQHQDRKADREYWKQGFDKAVEYMTKNNMWFSCEDLNEAYLADALDNGKKSILFSADKWGHDPDGLQSLIKDRSSRFEKILTQTQKIYDQYYENSIASKESFFSPVHGTQKETSYVFFSKGHDVVGLVPAQTQTGWNTALETKSLVSGITLDDVRAVNEPLGETYLMLAFRNDAGLKLVHYLKKRDKKVELSDLLRPQYNDQSIFDLIVEYNKVDDFVDAAWGNNDTHRIMTLLAALPDNYPDTETAQQSACEALLILTAKNLKDKPSEKIVATLMAGIGDQNSSLASQLSKDSFSFLINALTLGSTPLELDTLRIQDPSKKSFQDYLIENGKLEIVLKADWSSDIAGFRALCLEHGRTDTVLKADWTADIPGLRDLLRNPKLDVTKDNVSYIVALYKKHLPAAAEKNLENPVPMLGISDLTAMAAGAKSNLLREIVRQDAFPALQQVLNRKGLLLDDRAYLNTFEDDSTVLADIVIKNQVHIIFSSPYWLEHFDSAKKILQSLPAIKLSGKDVSTYLKKTIGKQENLTIAELFDNQNSDKGPLILRLAQAGHFDLVRSMLKRTGQSLSPRNITSHYKLEACGFKSLQEGKDDIVYSQKDSYSLIGVLSEREQLSALFEPEIWVNRPGELRSVFNGLSSAGLKRANVAPIIAKNIKNAVAANDVSQLLYTYDDLLRADDNQNLPLLIKFAKAGLFPVIQDMIRAMGRIIPLETYHELSDGNASLMQILVDQQQFTFILKARDWVDNPQGFSEFVDKLPQTFRKQVDEGNIDNRILAARLKSGKRDTGYCNH